MLMFERNKKAETQSKSLENRTRAEQKVKHTAKKKCTKKLTGVVLVVVVVIGFFFTRHYNFPAGSTHSGQAVVTSVCPPRPRY